MTVYITSDAHLGHANILRHEPARSTRWGEDVAHMDIDLIDEMHDCVCNGDTLIHVGDLSLLNTGKLLDYIVRIMPERPVGKPGTLKLVPGNHDGRQLRTLLKEARMPPHVEVLRDIVSMSHAGRKLVLCHYPLETWPGMLRRPDGRQSEPGPERGVLHLHGHSHGRGRKAPGRLDVGWDAHGRILTLDEALAMAAESERAASGVDQVA